MRRLDPLLYQVDTRTWLAGLACATGRPATLDDVPDRELDRFARQGFAWIWLLSVWQTGAAGERIARERVDLRKAFEAALPDLRDDDIGASGFAITGYVVSPALGGEAALARLRERLHARGLRLMLDFVPNHTAVDHPWAREHPEYYVSGTPGDLARAPRDYARIERVEGELLLAYGRDPNFPGWPDTLQLDYANPATREAMLAELTSVAGRCDGVRCDMAMLVLPDVFERTWGRRPAPFWPDATQRVREKRPDFCFMAEVYWDLERTLLEQGFDYAYDKSLYDRLRGGRASPVREHLRAPFDYQRKLARFLENHDEPRAAAAFAPGMHEAAAVITFLSPGLRFFHQGQLEGRRKHVPPQLLRAPREPLDAALAQFYERLLALLREPIFQDGAWTLCECTPAWDGNPTADGFIASTWNAGDGRQRLVAVNYASHPGQCYVRLARFSLAGVVRFRDLMGPASYERTGAELDERGLYLDLPAWGYHVFDVAR